MSDGIAFHLRTVPPVTGTAGQAGRCPRIGVNASRWGKLFEVNIAHPDSCDHIPHHGITYRYAYHVPPGYYRVELDDPWLATNPRYRVVLVE